MIHVSKSCDLDRCKGACCRFLTFRGSYGAMDEDIRKFYELHAIVAKTDILGTFLKVPIKCNQFDEATFKCKDYEGRPKVCREYPKTPSPFIEKGMCSQFDD